MHIFGRTLIDLLAAARCNMFSHCLVAYMSAILQFSKKSESTFKAVAEALTFNPRYDFCVLKELTQNINPLEIQTDDVDQSMFFSDDFTDKDSNSPGKLCEENQMQSILLEELNMPSNSDWFYNNEIDKYVADLKIQDSTGLADETKCQQDKRKTTKTDNKKSEDKEKWLNLFSELDPFENLQSFDSKLYTKSDTQQT